MPLKIALGIFPWALIFLQSLAGADPSSQASNLQTALSPSECGIVGDALRVDFGPSCALAMEFIGTRNGLFAWASRAGRKVQAQKPFRFALCALLYVV